MANVEIYQSGSLTIAKAGGKQIAACQIKGNARALFKAAIDTVPNGGSLNIGKGRYVFSAPYALPLNPDGSNIFYCGIPIIDKGMHISGAGAGQTILQLAPGQRREGRHVALMLVRGKRGFDPGYSSFSLRGVTFEGDRARQSIAAPHDGEGLLLVGSQRSNGTFENLVFQNSHGAGMYLGNNGSGPGTNETVRNVIARNCAAEGIMLDTNKDSQVVDCQAYGCRVGLFLNGNDDWRTRGSDNVTATRFKTDSQITCWQVNDFKISSLEMDCSKAKGAYGLVVRDGSGQVVDSKLKSDKKKASAYGSATYLYRGAVVSLVGCDISGYYGIRAIEKAKVRATNCDISASGACFAMVDQNAPMGASIIAEGCRTSGKKLETMEGATFEEI
ncbi:MAG TPA: right-handed parallel beta-helix repeat-containing protein [Methanothrix sp.]|nr:right-handed parallel beta-helix repeat-containing protein [Methanothrix sp.]